MGLLETEIKELRRLIKHYQAGKIDTETFKTLMDAYQRSEKRALLLMKAETMTDNQRKALTAKNIISPATAIDLSPEEIEAEIIHCPLKEEMINRADCLDFSGEEKNFESCHECENGLANKRLLCPPG